MDNFIEQLSINTIRTLSIDAIQKAKSGHPGAVMSLAPASYCLWQEFLKYSPNDPDWYNRDRFILSNGHTSMLIYSLLYLSKVKEHKKTKKLSVSLKEIKSFRQLNSKCPGHPEYNNTKGVEVTTGPLGQGLATSVGIAISEKWMSERFNKPSFNLINYNIYAVCGDGCIMEGLTAEAASLAGHLGLENLCWIYDNNNITIEGNTNLSFSEDIYARFKSYNWNVETIKDANNLKQLRFGYKNFLKNNTKPTLLIINSEIGFGSPNKQGFSTSHGKPLGEHECELTKKNYKWPYKQPFKIPNKVLKHFKNKIFKRGTKQAYYWYKLFTQYTKSYPTLAKEFTLIQKNILPKEWYYKLNKFKPSSIGIATRVASGKILNIIGKNIPWLIGGSADLNTSTNTLLTFKNSTNFSKNNLAGRNLYFGIRENCMASVLNGLALTKIRAYGATFLTFMDYLRPGLRLSALMEINPIYIFTHDSISIGEDGPTHQPIEHLSNLRALPRLITFRPADANEVIECWKIIIKLKHNPSALILTRQKLPILDRNKVASESGVKFGGYILLENKNKKPEILLLSTGSEVHLCVNAFYNLKKIGINARIISMPSFEIFEKQDTKYKNYIIPKHVKARIAIEQANSFGWERYIGDYGTTLSINNFGKSAPSKKLQNYFGFNAKTIIKLAINQLKKI